jgi:hypothetical protein
MTLQRGQAISIYNHNRTKGTSSRFENPQEYPLFAWGWREPEAIRALYYKLRR